MYTLEGLKAKWIPLDWEVYFEHKGPFGEVVGIKSPYSPTCTDKYTVLRFFPVGEDYAVSLEVVSTECMNELLTTVVNAVSLVS